MNQTAAPTRTDKLTIGSSWTSHVDETKRGLAKLLAREDITILHQPAETAMFNVKTRELILPTWSNITVDQYDLLIGHEVGHAKYTDELELLQDVHQYPGLFTYVNVIEDARIERRMKEEYPGLRASFRKGYADFFQYGPLFNNLKPVETYTLIDRLNIFFKLGANVDVPFSDAERVIVGRIERLRSFREAVSLAKELWNAEKQQSSTPQSAPEANKSQSKTSKSQQSTSQSSGQSGQSDDAESSDKESTDKDASGDSSKSEQSGDESNGNESGKESGESEDGDESEAGSESGDDDGESSETGASSKSGAGGGSKTSTNADPMSETDAQNSEALRKMGQEAMRNAGSSNNLRQWTLGALPREIVASHTVTNPQFLADVTAYVTTHASVLGNLGDAQMTSFNAKYAASIKYLASEFDRRKTAKLMDRVRQSRTGRLDVNKLHAYKFRDDLFKTALTTPKGQSHGIVTILDGSGSMGGYIVDVLHQAMFFGSFAQRLRIPFQAYMFLTSRNAGYGKPSSYVMPKGQLIPTATCQLVCLLDTMAPNWTAQLKAVSMLIGKYDRGYRDEDASLDWTEQTRRRHIWQSVPHSHLGSTPLYSSLLLADRYMAEMKSKHKLDKMSLLVVTDGEDSDGMLVANETTVDLSQTDNASHTGAIVRDTVLRRSYLTSSHSTTEYRGVIMDLFTVKPNALMDLLIGSLRARHEARIILMRLVDRPRKTTDARAAKLKRLGYNGLDDTDPLPEAQMFLKPFEKDQAAGRYDYTALSVLKTTSGPTMRDALRSDGGVYVLDAKLCMADGNLLVSTDALEINDDTFTDLDTSKLSTKQITKKFMQAAGKAQSNKVFVQAVVPFLI